MNYPINKALKKYRYLPFPFSPLALHIMNKLLVQAQKMVPCPDDLIEEQILIPCKDGNETISASLIKSQQISEPQPALIYFHGGGFVLESANLQKKLAYEYAKAIAGTVLFVHYRFAPKHPYPAGLEDAYRASEWFVEHATDLGIDRSRIMIGGDSAGANLAVATLLKYQDASKAPFTFQFLIYPVLDARQQTDSMHQFDTTPLWNSKRNQKMWQVYLDNKKDEHVRKYFSPIEANDFHQLPPAYIEVTEFDCLRDEGIAYAGALTHAQVLVILEEVKGAVHGFEVAWSEPFVQQQIQKRCQILQQALQRQNERKSNQNGTIISTDYSLSTN